MALCNNDTQIHESFLLLKKSTNGEETDPGNTQKQVTKVLKTIQNNKWELFELENFLEKFLGFLEISF